MARYADIRKLLASGVPADEIRAVLADALKRGSLAILPCSCPDSITVQLDSKGDAFVCHFSPSGDYEASTTIPAGTFGTPEGSAALHEWIARHHERREASQRKPDRADVYRQFRERFVSSPDSGPNRSGKDNQR